MLPYDDLIAADVDLSVATLTAIQKIAEAARAVGKPARVHIKVDTGFGRNGFTLAQIDSAIDLLLPLVDEGVFEIVGQWSHLAVADAPAVGEFVEKPTNRFGYSRSSPRACMHAGSNRESGISPTRLPH